MTLNYLSRSLPCYISCSLARAHQNQQGLFMVSVFNCSFAAFCPILTQYTKK